jgi:uncharacterized protein YceK
MNKIILLFVILLTGCSVIQTTHNEMKNELIGFKEDWARTFGSKQTN